MSESFLPTTYQLQSVASGNLFGDSGWVLDAPGEAVPSLVRAIYAEKQLQVKGEEFGLYRYADWLPVSRMLNGSTAPVTYKSIGLANVLGLSNLYITFSGYWPERGAGMTTCSFKETEAYAVCGRLDPKQEKVLVVASAGNTARAFAKVCSDNNIPLLLCVPKDYITALWFEKPLNNCVKLVVTESGSDYFDAIHLSNQVCRMDGFVAEGGAKNVARRDGMGTTMLSATTHIGRIPDLYFQAIGSGTGAIAAWEANLRFIADGRYGSHKMKLMVSQNAPFTPIYEAWKAGSRQMLPYEDVLARQHAEQISAKVLSNRKPPYPIVGGLYDALRDTGGDVLVTDNEEAAMAGKLFEQLEGIDLHPAAAVATASLIRQAEEEGFSHDAVVMLNITGGGEQRFKLEKDLHFLQPDLVFSIHDEMDVIEDRIRQLSWK